MSENSRTSVPELAFGQGMYLQDRPSGPTPGRGGRQSESDQRPTTRGPADGPGEPALRS